MKGGGESIKPAVKGSGGDISKADKDETAEVCRLVYIYLDCCWEGQLDIC